MTMTKTIFSGFAITALAFTGIVLPDGPAVKMESLPPAVQAAVKAQTANATILNISAEKEDGKMEYEVETKVAGKTRDLVFDATGAVLEIEEETDFDSIPAAAKATIQKQLGSATLKKVEKVTRGSKITYEATLKSIAGKNFEVGVTAEGKLLSRKKEEN